MNNQEIEIIVLCIIDMIRQSIIQMNQDIPDSGQWNEEEGGAAWLDNELYAFHRMINYSMMMPLMRNQLPWGNLHSVNEFQEYLSNESSEYLNVFHQFIQNGGTASEEWNSFIEQNNIVVQNEQNYPSTSSA